VQGIKALSKIEKEILQKIKEGFTSGEIAMERGCSVRTVEKHRSNMIDKLGIKSTQNALLLWINKNPKYFNT